LPISGARLRALPAWAWLVAIVVASTAFRAVAARSMPGPFIFIDELIYSELGKSFAAGGHFLVRGVPTSGYGVVYPVLISPAYRLFHDLPVAYALVKTINSLVMSLAAVPAYLLARRMVTQRLALFAAVLTVAVPSMVYTGTVMTENVFYGLFLVVMLALVSMLERPTRWRQAIVLALVVAAYLTRAQSLAFVPAIVAAPLILALFEGRPLRRAFERHATLYGTIVVGGVGLVVLQIARGHSLGGLLGAYSVVGSRHYDVRAVADFTLWHAADLALYVGVIPLAAALLLIARARHETREVQAFLAASIPVAVSFTVVVGAFATRFASDRIHERNLFQLSPLLFVALLVWASRHDAGLRRNWPLGVAAVAVAAAAPLTIPYGRFIGEPVRGDTLALLPVWTISRHFLAGSVLLTVGLVCAALGVLVLLVPRRGAVALPIVVLAWFALLVQPVFAGPHGFKHSSAGAVFQGIRGVDRDWIDDAVPKGARVSVLWSGPPVDQFVVWQNEFFNRAVGQVYYTRTPTDGGINEKRIRFDRSGLAHTAGGLLVRPRYLLTDGAVTPDGMLIALDTHGESLWRLRGPLFSTTTVTGLFPDTWSRKHVTWTRRRCRGGVLQVTLNSGPELFSGPNRVDAEIGGRRYSATVARLGLSKMRIPIPAGVATCVVRFTVAQTLVPSVVTHGANGDTRRLGAHFDIFEYRAAT
jgi:hypothetical protein